MVATSRWCMCPGRTIQRLKPCQATLLKRPRPRHLKYYFVEDAEYSMAHNTILMANQVIILRSLKAKVPAALHPEMQNVGISVGSMFK